MSTPKCIKFDAAIVGLMFFAVPILTPSLHAQKNEWTPSIDEKSMDIIDRCIKAMGGEMNLDAAATIELKGTSKFKHDTDIDFRNETSRTVYLKNGYERSITRYQNGPKILHVQRGRLSWIVVNQNETEANVMNSSTVVQGVIPWPGVVLNWKESDKAIHFLGSAKYDDKYVNTLVFSRSDGAVAHFHFEVESGLLIAVEQKTKATGKEIDWVREYNYKTVEGIALPLTQKLFEPGLHETIFEYEVVKIGGNIPDEYFAMTPTIKRRMEELNERRNARGK